MKNNMVVKSINMMVVLILFLSVFTMASRCVTGEATDENLSEMEYQIIVGDVDTSKIRMTLSNILITTSEVEKIPVMIKIDNNGLCLEDIKFNNGAVVSKLRTTANELQIPIKAYLHEQDIEVLNHFWLANYILVNVTSAQIENLTRLSSVRWIVENFDITILDYGKENVSHYTYTEGIRNAEIIGGLHEHNIYQTDYTWGLNMIRAPDVWKELGFRGEGVLWCSSDTGVDITHPDLQGKMWTDDPADSTYPGGWIEFDSNGNPVSGSTPHDTNSHGTHTAGTGVGGDTSGTAIGVAPDAWLMHALILPYGGGTFAQVVAGMEWSVDPYDSAGNPAGNPADVHSMSWGASGYYDDLIEPVQNMYYANVIPVASIGNSYEGSSGSPGNIYESFGIGASDDTDHIASFSSGEIIQKNWFSNPPEDWPDEWVKPDFSAPGVNVMSSIPGGGYAYYSGTSMAAPHVAGVIALIKSANPNVPPDMIYTALKDTAVWYDYYYPEPPDTRYGWGRIDAYNSTLLLAFDSGIQGYVTDSDTGEPLNQATVAVTNETVFRTSTSNTNGFYKAYLRPGTYNMTLSRFGYYDKDITNIVVSEDQWIWYNTSLDLLPYGYIAGEIYYNATGYSIPGVTVKVLDIPVEISTIGDDDALYLLQIPIGTYSIEAISPYFQSSRVDSIQVNEDMTTTINIAMYLWETGNIAVMGDYEDTITNMLIEKGYSVEQRGWDIISEVSQYGVIIVNAPGDPGSATFLDFIDATDTSGTGVIFLDTWAHTYGGGGVWLLHNYLSNPPSRDTDYDTYMNYLYYEVTESHPILEGYAPGDTFVFESTTYYHDHAYFDGYTGENGLVIANAGNDLYGIMGEGIAVDNRVNNKHVLMSMHGASYFVDPTYWTDEAEQVFLNAVEWVSPAITEDVVMVDWDIKIGPEVALWYEDFNITIKAKNVGAEAGWYTASLYINGEVEDSNVTKLSPNTWKTVKFTVNREPVGNYTVTIGPHTTTFRVRPPRVTVKAESIEPLPLSNGTLLAYNKSIGMQTIGYLDSDGKLTFDSPVGSRGNYTIIISNPNFRMDDNDGAQHYLLKQDVYIDDDSIVVFSPTIGNSSFMEIYLEQAHPRHSGRVEVKINEIPFTYFGYSPGTLILTSGVYKTTSVMYYKTELATWLYSSKEEEEHNLSEPKTITYRFGGTLLGMIHTATVDDEVTIYWNITDAYYNNLTEIVEVGVGPLNIKQSDITHKPLIILYDTNSGIIRSGYVEWSDKPAETTISPGTTVVYSQISVETGPYQLDNKINLSCVIKDWDDNIISDGSMINNGVVNVTGNVKRANQPVQNVTVTVNGDSTTTDISGQFSITVNLSSGYNEIKVEVVDLAGTIRTTLMSVTLKNTVYLLVYPISSPTTKNNISVSGVVEVGATLTINDVGVSYDADGLFSMGVNLSEDVNTILVRVEDSVGNVAEKTLTIIRDTLPPEIINISASNGTVTREERMIVSGTTEPGATILVNGIQGTINSNGNFSAEIMLLEGNNSISIVATDSLRNTHGINVIVLLKKTVYLELDPIEPVIDRTTMTISGRVEEGATLTIDGVEVTAENGIFSYELSLSEGKNEINVRGEDRLGNVAEETIVIMLDTTEEALRSDIENLNTKLDTTEEALRSDIENLNTKLDELTTLMWLMLAVLVAMIFVVGVLGKRKRGIPMPPEDTRTSQPPQQPPVPPPPTMQPVQPSYHPQSISKPTAKPILIKCGKCGQTIQITSSVRPLEVVCPKCGEKGILR